MILITVGIIGGVWTYSGSSAGAKKVSIMTSSKVAPGLQPPGGEDLTESTGFVAGLPVSQATEIISDGSSASGAVTKRTPQRLQQSVSPEQDGASATEREEDGDRDVDGAVDTLRNVDTSDSAWAYGPNSTQPALGTTAPPTQHSDGGGAAEADGSIEMTPVRGTESSNIIQRQEVCNLVGSKSSKPFTPCPRPPPTPRADPLPQRTDRD